MSAIVGIHHLTSEPVPYEAIHRMMRALHRYPANDIRTWHSSSTGLGCHAQWITPESVHEKLPYYDAGHNIAITADAIIDNRDELFQRLQIEWPRRKSMTDSELIVLAYVRWGEEAPRYLIGDFAFVIWDANKKQLFGARDRLGNRTLHYHYDHRRFAFSTVIPPLFELDGLEKQLNESWLAQFLAIPTMLDVADVRLTAYRHISHVPPAHAFSVSSGKGLKLWQYQSFQVPKPLRLRSNGEYEEAMRDVLRMAVTARTRTFRQVGSSLSGGLDSGTVVSFAAPILRAEGKTLHTFSSIPQGDYVDWTSHRTFADESPYIESTVQHVGGLNHHYLDFADSSPLTEVDEWVRLLNAPYKCFENSFWLRGIFEQARNNDVGVLLTGAGGNMSISWGHGVDYYGHLLRRLRLFKLNHELKQYGQRLRMGRKQLLPYIARQAFPVLSRSRASSVPEIPTLIHPEFARKSQVADQIKDVAAANWNSKLNFIASRADEFEQLVYPHASGTIGTPMSLHYAIVERDPTYDPRVIEFCLSVPLEQYVQDGVDRSLIRRATKGYLPDKVRLNQSQRGIQGSDWMHRVIPDWDFVTEELDQLCRDDRCTYFMNTEQIRRSQAAIGSNPRPDQAYDSNARLLMRSIIVYRFMKQLA